MPVTHYKRSRLRPKMSYYLKSWCCAKVLNNSDAHFDKLIAKLSFWCLKWMEVCSEDLFARLIVFWYLYSSVFSSLLSLAGRVNDWSLIYASSLLYRDRRNNLKSICSSAHWAQLTNVNKNWKFVISDTSPLTCQTIMVCCCQQTNTKYVSSHDAF